MNKSKSSWQLFIVELLRLVFYCQSFLFVETWILYIIYMGILRLTFVIYGIAGAIILTRDFLILGVSCTNSSYFLKYYLKFRGC